MLPYSWRFRGSIFRWLEFWSEHFILSTRVDCYISICHVCSGCLSYLSTLHVFGSQVLNSHLFGSIHWINQVLSTGKCVLDDTSVWIFGTYQLNVSVTIFSWELNTICLSKLNFHTKEYGHTLQEYSFLTVCIHLCRCKVDLCTNQA